jgi:hypothetical protein
MRNLKMRWHVKVDYFGLFIIHKWNECYIIQ